MTSRDFGITTLRNAVAYHFDGSIVPSNNVYITSTNGAAIFSDSLTISTINVSTINGGGGGSQTLSQTGNIVSLNPSGSMVDIASTTLVSSTGVKTTHQALVGSNTEFGGGCVCIRSNNGLSVGLIGGDTIDIYEGVISGIDSGFNLGGTLAVKSIQDNSSTIGTAGQLLTAGAGGELLWSTISGGGGGGSVNSVSSGINISTSGTASDPIINVYINSTLEMNGNNIHSSGALGITSDASLNLDGTSTNMVSSDGGILLQTNGTTKKITLDIGEGLFDVVATDIRLYGLSTLQTTKMVYIAEGTGYLSVGDLPSSVNSVTAGTNISITGTASTPIINVDINSTLLMNGFPIYDYSTITIASGSTINLSTASTSIVLDQASTNITITSITGPINLTGNPVVIKNVTPVLQFDDTTTSTNITFYNNGSAFGDTALITNAGELGVYNETGGQSMRIGTSTIGGFPISYIMGLSTAALFIGENGASSFSNITLGSTSISLKLDKRLDTDFNSTAANIELLGTGEIDVVSFYGSINVTASTGVNVTADTGGINLTSPIITMSTLNTAFTNKILYYNTTDGAVTYDDAPPGTTGVVSVSSGINISTTGTAINPIINVNINSTLDMNFNNIINVSTINLKSADSAQIQFYNSTNVLAGALTYNQAAEFLTLECSTVLNIKTTQVGVGTGIIINSNSSNITLETNGGQINICSHYLPGEPSTNRINILADGDGGEIEINAPELITITTQSSLNMTAVSGTGDAVMKMTGDFINLSTLNNLNMYVGSTINMTGGTTLISSTYLLLTINNTPYKIALL